MRLWRVLLAFCVALVLLAAASGAWLATRDRIVLRTNVRSPFINETALWSASDGIDLWVEAPAVDTDWYRQLLDDPMVEVREHGRTHRFLAQPEPSARTRVRRLHRDKYGWADLALGLLRDPERVIAVRLKRLPDSGTRA